MCPSNFNPADFFVQLLAIVPGQEEQCRERTKVGKYKWHMRHQSLSNTQFELPWVPEALSCQCFMVVGFVSVMSKDFLMLDRNNLWSFCSKYVISMMTKKNSKKKMKATERWVHVTFSSWGDVTVACSLVAKVLHVVPEISLTSHLNKLIDNCPFYFQNSFSDDEVVSHQP